MGCFEQWLRDLCVREVTPCHGDYMVSSLWRRFFVIRLLQERQNQSLSCVGAQHRNAHAKTCYSTHHEHGMNFHIDSCLTSLDRYRKSFDQSSLSLSLVLCSETFGMDTLTCCSNKCLVEHHSLGIFTQAVLWLYGSPPLWCVGMSRVCP